MTTENQRDLSSQMQSAVNELRQTVKERYPEATFRIYRGQDEPEAVHLIATVDIDDPDEVVDLVIERVLEFQLDKGLPVHVIPIRPLARVLEDQASQRHRARPRIDWGAAIPNP